MSMIFRKMLAYLPSKVFPAVMSFIFVWVLTRSISPEAYGTYNIYLTTLSILSIGLFSFLQASALRFYQQYAREGLVQSFHTTFLLNYSVMSLAALFLSVLITIIFDWPIQLAFWAAAYLFLENLYNFIQAEHRMQGEAHWYSLMSIGHGVLRLIFLGGMVLWFSINDVSALLPGLCAYAMLAVIGGTLQVRRSRLVSDAGLEQHYSSLLAKDSLRYGIPLIGAGLLSILLSGADRYLIHYFLGEEAVGIYSLAYRLTDIIINNASLLLLYAVYPVLIENFDADASSDTATATATAASAAAENLKRFINLFLFLIIPMSVGYLYFSSPLIRLLFPDYAGAEALMPSLASGAFLFGLTYLTNKPFELHKRPKPIFFLLALSVMSNILLNMLLIPFMGIQGAAVSTAVSYLFYAVGSYIWSRKFMYYRFDAVYAFRVLLCSLGAWFSALSVNAFFSGELSLWKAASDSGHSWLNLIGSFTAYIAVYAGLSLLFKTTTPIKTVKTSKHS